MTLLAAIRRARKACEAMRPRMLVGEGAAQWVTALDDLHYTENANRRDVYDPWIDALRLFSAGGPMPLRFDVVIAKGRRGD